MIRQRQRNTVPTQDAGIASRHHHYVDDDAAGDSDQDIFCPDLYPVVPPGWWRQAIMPPVFHDELVRPIFRRKALTTPEVLRVIETAAVVLAAKVVVVRPGRHISVPALHAVTAMSCMFVMLTVLGQHVVRNNTERNQRYRGKQFTHGHSPCRWHGAEVVASMDRHWPQHQYPAGSRALRFFTAFTKR